MRIILSAIVLIITLATNVGANVEGQMNCNVKSNSVTTIEEGKYKEFSGYEDSFAVGDDLIIIYKEMRGNFTVTMEDPVRGDQFMTADVNKNFPERSFHEPKYSEGILVRSKNDLFNPRFITSSPEFEMSIFANSEIISASNNLSSIELRRYYKNDWQGVFFNKVKLKLQIATLDCRHTKDSLNTFIKALGFGLREQLQKKAITLRKSLREKNTND